MDSDPRSPVCPACSRPVRPGTSFCGGCGAPLPPSIADDAGPSGAELPASVVGPVNPWRRILPSIWMWILLLAVNGVVGIYVRITETSSPSLLVAAELLGIPIVLLCGFRSRTSWAKLLRSGPFGARSLLFAAAALGVIFVWMNGYFFLVSLLGVETLNEAEDFVRAGWPVFAMLVVGSLLPAAIEEVAFRGVVQAAFEEVGNAREAILIQAGMFAFLHLSPVVFVSHFGFGWVLGYLRLRSRSLLPGMLVHALWNAWVILGDIGEMGAA
ncbi:MAG: CPBP family intramembrane metalloprotease [Myxococcales bacterium]|nr:CPBP family intramembrane metalloprotease [Myxococcales bacterium]